jgi:serine protease inhibitor
MRRCVLALMLASLCMGFTSCSDRSFAPTDGSPPQVLLTPAELGDITNTFGFNVFKELVKHEPDANIVISPVSISLCLGMVQNGAAESTLEDMMATLGLSEYTLESANQAYRDLMDYLMTLDFWVQCQVANSIWYRDRWTLQEGFRRNCEYYFDSEVNGLDFSRGNAPDVINQWVYGKTGGRIPEIILEPIPSIVEIILVNAVYFKGFWTHKFNRNATGDAWFTLPDGSKQRCRMMYQGPGTNYTAYEGPNFYGMDMAYGDSIFSMTVLLPKPGVHVDSVVARLDQANWKTWAGGFEPWYGMLHMPKFELEYFVELEPVLRALGMAQAFDNGCAFTEMLENTCLFLLWVRHRTYIRVDEDGTEAAAVTDAGGATGIPPEFTIDRPFIFLIRDNLSDTVLFLGKVADPGYF